MLKENVDDGRISDEVIAGSICGDDDYHDYDSHGNDNDDV